MNRKSVFWEGVTTGLLLSLALNAIRWLMTPIQHPDASSFRYAAVALQLLAGLVGVVWLLGRQKGRTTA